MSRGTRGYKSPALRRFDMLLARLEEILKQQNNTEKGEVRSLSDDLLKNILCKTHNLCLRASSLERALQKHKQEVSKSFQFHNPDLKEQLKKAFNDLEP